MKIQRFNESTSQTIKDFILDFTDNAGDIPDWINTIAPETLKEYENVLFFNRRELKKSLKFADDKNLPKFKEYMLLDGKIEKMKKEIDNLIKYKETVSYVEGSSELLYRFQLDLLENDYDKFYEFFLKDQIEEEYENIYSEVHPNLIKNIKYKKMIDVNIDANKYNL